MDNREGFLLWCEVTKLVDAALGVSMIADYDCADAILNADDCQLARGAQSTAAVIMLRKAAELLVTLEEHIKRTP
jgi:hypothetical protein